MGKMINRKLVGVNLPWNQIKWLARKKDQTGAAVSRIVERIIQNEIDKEKIN